MTVISDADQRFASIGNINGNALCSGINSIFCQLFDCRGRTLDHFASCDAVHRGVV